MARLLAAGQVDEYATHLTSDYARTTRQGRLERRDAALAAWQARHPTSNAYEDRDLEVTSEIAISVDDQIRAVRAALKRGQR